MWLLPSLNETWAVVYLQLLIAILIFGLGIPSLVIQAIAPDDLRTLIHRRRNFMYLLAPWIITVFIIFSHIHLAATSN